MPSTSRGYPYPSGSDDVDIPGDMQALADAVNTDVGAIAATTPSAPVLQTLADAAGDLIVASANDTFAKKSLGTDNHVLTVDTSGSGAAKVAWEDPTANPLTVTAMALKVNAATVGNLLTANQASVETDTTGFVGLSNVTSMLASTDAALHGSKSLKVTSTGSADTLMQISSGLDTYDVPATAGQTYTFAVYIKSAATARTANVAIIWRDGGGSGLATTTGGNVTTSTSGWTRVLVTGVAPAGTANAQPVVTIKSSVASEVHYIDCLGFWEGAGGQWALPGTPITNLGFYTDESCGRRLFQWDANNSRFQQTFGDTGWRDVTSLVDTSGWTNAPTALAVYVRRTLEQSSMIVQWNPGTGSCSGQGVVTLPPGFGPAESIVAPGGAWQAADTGAYTGGWYWETGTKLDLQSPATSVYLRAIATLPCTDAWPTSLPGSAVGSIPQ